MGDWMGWLKKTWRVARIRNMEIRIHISMILIVFFFYTLIRPADGFELLTAAVLVLGLFVSVLLHEMGHAAAALRLGFPVKSIVLWPLGGFTNLAGAPERPLHRFLVSAAGPLVNAILMLVFSLAWLSQEVFVFFQSGSSGPALFWAGYLHNLLFGFAVLNAVLVIFNLLPIYPLDGGNMFKAIMQMLFGETRANTITLIVSLPLLMLLVLFGVWSGDYLLLGTCILMALGIATLNREALNWISLAILYLFNRAGYYFMQGDYIPAIEAYTRVLSASPERIDCYIGRSAAYLHLNQMDHALADVERALEIEPENPVALLLRGEYHQLRQQTDQALACYNRVIHLMPQKASAYADRGGLYMDRGELVSALADFDRAIHLNRSVAVFFCVRSQAHYRLRDFEAAKRDCLTALGLSEKAALLKEDFNLSSYKDQLDWAQAYYGWAQEKYPRLWMVYQGRADAFCTNQYFEDALGDYTRAIELAPHEASLYLKRGTAYQRNGQSQAAAQDFQRAHSLATKAHLRQMATNSLAQVVPV